MAGGIFGILAELVLADMQRKSQEDLAQQAFENQKALETQRQKAEEAAYAPGNPALRNLPEAALPPVEAFGSSLFQVPSFASPDGDWSYKKFVTHPAGEPGHKRGLEEWRNEQENTRQANLLSGNRENFSAAEADRRMTEWAGRTPEEMRAWQEREAAARARAGNRPYEDPNARLKFEATLQERLVSKGGLNTYLTNMRQSAKADQKNLAEAKKSFWSGNAKEAQAKLDEDYEDFKAEIEDRQDLLPEDKATALARLDDYFGKAQGGSETLAPAYQGPPPGTSSLDLVPDPSISQGSGLTPEEYQRRAEGYKRQAAENEARRIAAIKNAMRSANAPIQSFGVLR